MRRLTSVATNIVDGVKMIDSLQHIRQHLGLVPQILMLLEKFLAIRVLAIHVDRLRVQRCLATLRRRNSNVHFAGDNLMSMGKLWLSRIRETVLQVEERPTRYHPVGCPFAGLALTEVSTNRMEGFAAIP
jgi:hypothetical protein